ncbi:MAG: CRTAC1 family protein [Acidobacteria bacterium]|nr:CRTAC1 family protein [Acidobacteriota bacterium]
MKRKLSRRKQLMIRYGLLSLSSIVVASLGIFLFRPSPKPYAPGEKVEGITSTLERYIPADYPRVVFTDVAKEAKIDFVHFYGSRSTQLPEDMGSGAAWGDYDNDGDQDLYICNLAGPLTTSEEDLARSPASNRLYRNNGDGTFIDVTEQAGLGYKGWSMGAAWGDYDTDGLLDLFVTTYGTNRLYRNNGNGTFSDVTEATGVGRERGFWASASWADYDLDGDLDIYVCGYVQYRSSPEDLTRKTMQYGAEVPFTLNPSSYEPERNLLYRNNGHGRFTEVAKSAGVDNPTGRSLSAAWCDFNRDGWPDLYVANDISDNAMFMNPGNGRFADVSHPAWVADYRGAMGLGIGDWDNDGDMDIFITHWIAQENALFDNLLYALGGGRGEGKLVRFIDIADQVGLGQIALDYIGWGTSFFDYNNDGRQDLFVVNGSTFQDENDPRRLVPMRNLLFWNKDEKGFFEVGQVSGEIFSREDVGRGAAFADYDNDGDVDVLVVNHSGRPLLLRNDGGNRNHWLRVKVRGVKSNRLGIGAKIEITANGQKQIDEIGAQPSYLSQNELVAHFGLGKVEQVEKITVVFPRGRTVERSNIRANQTVIISEQ